MDAGGRATHGAVAESVAKPNRRTKQQGLCHSARCWVSLRSTQPTSASGALNFYGKCSRMNLARERHEAAGESVECRLGTTAWMQEVEQRMEQLPRAQRNPTDVPSGNAFAILKCVGFHYVQPNLRGSLGHFKLLFHAGNYTEFINLKTISLQLNSCHTQGFLCHLIL